MYFLIYSSYASRKYDDSELEAILVKSRDKNKWLGITGMLLYFHNEFLQLIEGEEEKVKTLFEDICKDERHYDLLIMKEGEIENRFFEDWSMAFKSVSPTDMEKIEGYKDSAAPGGKNADAIFHLFKILSAAA